MENNTYIDGAITKKNKELIAIGISVATNCESCMEWHIKQALDNGASQHEIIEAIEVGYRDERWTRDSISQVRYERARLLQIIINYNEL